MKNKIFITVFIIVYLGQFFFCIFFRIESWPFSDYSMYRSHTHPKRVKVYIPYFKLSDGSYIPPVLNNKIVLSINKVHFHKAYRKYDSADYDRYINALLKSNSMKKSIEKNEKIKSLSHSIYHNESKI